jgi:hypothetical protein
MHYHVLKTNKNPAPVEEIIPCAFVNGGKAKTKKQKIDDLNYLAYAIVYAI